MVGGLTTLALFVAALISFRKYRSSVETSKRTGEIFLTIFAVSFGFALGQSFSAGLSVEIWLLALGFAFSMFAKFIQKVLATYSAQFAAILLAFVILIPTGIIQSFSPYNWWGITGDRLTSSHVQSEVEGLRKFSLGPLTTKTYNDIQKGLLGISDSKNGVLWGPNLGGVPPYVLGGRLKTYSLECPILWYDICPSVYAERDFEKLKAAPPDAIVWFAAPAWVLDGHAAGFTEAQVRPFREIQTWVLQQSNTSEYRVSVNEPIAVDGTSPVDSWNLLVLVRN
jgi:hypothetical protein